MVRFLIPSVAVLLFLLEPEFAMLSRLKLKGKSIFGTAFLILYLILYPSITAVNER